MFLFDPGTYHHLEIANNNILTKIPYSTNVELTATHPKAAIASEKLCPTVNAVTNHINFFQSFNSWPATNASKNNI